MSKQHNLTVKIGRPTLYNSQTPGRVFTYVKNCLQKHKVPTIPGFAMVLGVSERSIYAWRTEHEEFMQAIEVLETTQKHLVIDGGLTGKFNPRFAAFILGANHGMSDKQPIINNTQNNFLNNISADLIAEALALMHAKGKLGDNNKVKDSSNQATT